MATVEAQAIIAGLNAYRINGVAHFSHAAADLEVDIIEEIGALLIVIGAACEDESVYRHHIKRAIDGVETLLALTHAAASARP